MASFEDLQTACTTTPTTGEVMARIQREERCEGNPLSHDCPVDREAIIAYLTHDKAAVEICKDCPGFARVLQKMMAEWEEWTLRRQERPT